MTLRALPSGKEEANGVLARSIYETAAREAWKIEELHTEDGHLDDVFRSITLGDTAGAGRTEAKK